MTRVIRAVDVSEFTRDIRPQWWKMVADQHGIEAAVIQAWGGGYTGGRSNIHFHQQIGGARAAGLAVAAYVWPPSEWNEAINWIGDARPYCAFLALDVEAGAAVNRTHVSGVASRGTTPVIYTSPGDWGNVMGGNTTFGDLPLWLARYKWVAGPAGYYRERWDVEMGEAFGTADHVGGWHPGDGKLIGWQFAGTTQIGEETCDINIFYESAFRAPVEIPQFPQEDDEMKPLLLQKPGNHRVLYTDGVSSWHVPNREVFGIIRTLGAAHIILPPEMAPLWDALWALWERTRG